MEGCIFWGGTIDTCVCGCTVTLGEVSGGEVRYMAVRSVRTPTLGGRFPMQLASTYIPPPTSHQKNLYFKLKTKSIIAHSVKLYVTNSELHTYLGT
jgi:hypothetical protein